LILGLVDLRAAFAKLVVAEEPVDTDFLIVVIHQVPSE